AGPDRAAILAGRGAGGASPGVIRGDRKSTRLNSSHSQISYAAFCLKKKKRGSSGKISTCDDAIKMTRPHMVKTMDMLRPHCDYMNPTPFPSLTNPTLCCQRLCRSSA